MVSASAFQAEDVSSSLTIRSIIYTCGAWWPGEIPLMHLLGGPVATDYGQDKLSLLCVLFGPIVQRIERPPSKQ
jgi:hypothetical protein